MNSWLLRVGSVTILHLLNVLLVEDFLHGQQLNDSTRSLVKCRAFLFGVLGVAAKETKKRPAKYRASVLDPISSPPPSSRVRLDCFKSKFPPRQPLTMETVAWRHHAALRVCPFDLNSGVRQ